MPIKLLSLVVIVWQSRGGNCNLTENARFAREQIDILNTYVNAPWENLDWKFVRRHSAQLLAHVDDLIRHQEKDRADLVTCERV